MATSGETVSTSQSVQVVNADQNQPPEQTLKLCLKKKKKKINWTEDTVDNEGRMNRIRTGRKGGGGQLARSILKYFSLKK